MNAPPTGTVRLRGHVLDVQRQTLARGDGTRVELRPQALDLLCCLARHAGHVVRKEELLAEVWPGLVVTDDSLVQAVGDVRRALGDTAHAVVQTVPRRGYRLLLDAAPEQAPSEVPASPAAPSDLPAASSAAAEAPQAVDAKLSARGADPKPAAWRRWAMLAVLASTVAGSLAAWQPWRATGSGGSSPAPDRPPIAVLDFRDADASAEEQMLARGFAEDLIGELSRNADLRVIAAHSSFSAASSTDALPRVAERLGAGYLVNGSVRREGERLRMAVQLIDGRDSRVVWTERQEVGAAEVYSARDAIVRRVAGTLHSTMRGNEEARMQQRPPASLDIYEMTLRAITLKHRFTPKDSREAKALLERVVALDPQYAPGWLYLGMVNVIDTTLGFSGPPTPERYREAIAQLEHSVTLNPHLPPAQSTLAYAYSLVGRPHDALRAARRGVELGPNDGECLTGLALALFYTGQAQEALRYARLGMEINPLPPGYVLATYGAALGSMASTKTPSPPSIAASSNHPASCTAAFTAWSRSRMWAAWTTHGRKPRRCSRRRLP